MASRRGSGSRRLVADIDRQIAEMDRELRSVRGLVARRNSLVAARKALTGERDRSLAAPGVKMHLRVGEVVDFVREHPGLTRSEIADELGASVDAVYKHLRRNKDKFVDRGFKWYLVGEERGER